VLWVPDSAAELWYHETPLDDSWWAPDSYSLAIYLA